MIKDYTIKLDIDYTADILAEKYDNLFSLMTPKSYLFSGAVSTYIADQGIADFVCLTDSYANIESIRMVMMNSIYWNLYGNGDAYNTGIRCQPKLFKARAVYSETTSDAMSTVRKDEHRLPSIYNAVRRSGPIYTTRAQYYENRNIFANINGVRVMLITSEEDTLNSIRGSAIRLNGVVVNHNGDVYEVIKGAEEDCKKRVINKHIITMQTDCDLSGKIIDAFTASGWRSNITTKTITNIVEHITKASDRKAKRKKLKTGSDAFYRDKYARIINSIKDIKYKYSPDNCSVTLYHTKSLEFTIGKAAPSLALCYSTIQNIRGGIHEAVQSTFGNMSGVLLTMDVIGQTTKVWLHHERLRHHINKAGNVNSRGRAGAEEINVVKLFVICFKTSFENRMRSEGNLISRSFARSDSKVDAYKTAPSLYTQNRIAKKYAKDRTEDHENHLKKMVSGALTGRSPTTKRVPTRNYLEFRILPVNGRSIEANTTSKAQGIKFTIAKIIRDTITEDMDNYASEVWRLAGANNSDKINFKRSSSVIVRQSHSSKFDVRIDYDAGNVSASAVLQAAGYSGKLIACIYNGIERMNSKVTSTNVPPPIPDYVSPPTAVESIPPSRDEAQSKPWDEVQPKPKRKSPPKMKSPIRNSGKQPTLRAIILDKSLFSRLEEKDNFVSFLKKSSGAGYIITAVEIDATINKPCYVIETTLSEENISSLFGRWWRQAGKNFNDVVINTSHGGNILSISDRNGILANKSTNSSYSSASPIVAESAAEPPPLPNSKSATTLANKTISIDKSLFSQGEENHLMDYLRRNTDPSRPAPFIRRRSPARFHHVISVTMSYETILRLFNIWWQERGKDLDIIRIDENPSNKHGLVINNRDRLAGTKHSGLSGIPNPKFTTG